MNFEGHCAILVETKGLWPRVVIVSLHANFPEIETYSVEFYRITKKQKDSGTKCDPQMGVEPRSFYFHALHAIVGADSLFAGSLRPFDPCMSGGVSSDSSIQDMKVTGPGFNFPLRVTFCHWIFFLFSLQNPSLGKINWGEMKINSKNVANHFEAIT